MAKHRKQKKKSAQPARLEKPAIDEALRQERILPIIAALRSANPAERTVTLGALANIIEDPKMRQMLLKERLLQIILSNTLSDSSLEVVAEGFGVLRNIVLAEGRDAAVFLVREHIRLPLNAVAAKSQPTLADLGSLDKQRLEMLNQMMENIFGLVTALVLSIGELLDVRDVALLALELIRLRSDNILKQTFDAAFEVLYYLSEDNEEMLQELSGESHINTLRSTALGVNSWQARIYELGIECNLVLLDGALADADTGLVPRLVEFLNQVPATEINSLQVCLELLAVAAQTDNVDVLTFLLSEAVTVVLGLVAKPKFSLRSVSFINNVGWSLNGAKQDWRQAAATVFERTVSACIDPANDGEVLTSTLGLISALLVQDRNLVRNDNLIQAIPKLFERVDELYRNEDEEWVALASALVNILGSVAPDIGFVAPTADLIFSLLEHTKSAQAQVDALNALFDLFGDNDAPYNQVEYNDKDRNAKLEQIAPNVKRVLRSPNKDGALRAQADDALENLNNFIVYKKE